MGTPSPERAGERWIEAALFAAAAVSTLAVATIFGFIGWFSLPFASGGRLIEVLSWTWQPAAGSYGILPMVVGSVLLALTSIAIAYPVGLGVCCFIHGLGPKGPARLLLLLVRFMTSIPTVVYGFVAVFLLVPAVRALAPGGSGFCWLSAGLTLALLILPTIALVLDAEFQQLEPRFRATTASMGLTRAQSLLYVVLPLSRRGLVTAAVLGFGRAVGDTLVALMVSGNAAQVPGSPFDSLRTLTAHVALVVATDSRSQSYDSLFAAALILLLTATVVNLSLRSLRLQAR